MNQQSVLTLAEERYPKAGWRIIEGHHEEMFIVSPRIGRPQSWDASQAMAVAADLVGKASIVLLHNSTAASRFGHSSRAYVAVQAINGTWSVADAFVRFDQPDTLPFTPPNLEA